MSSREAILTRLRHESLLRHLSPASWEQAVGELVVVQRRESRYLLRRGQAAAQVFFVVEGAVRVFHRIDDAREVLLKLFRPPSMFGEIEVLCACPVIEFAMTLVPSSIACLPAAAFSRLLAHDNAFTVAVLRDVAARLCVASSNERELAFTQVLPRLARLLVDYASVYSAPDGPRRVIVSQVAMARDLGVTRKAVVAGLAKLRALGLVARQGRYTVLLAPAALAQLAPKAASLAHVSQ